MTNQQNAANEIHTVYVEVVHEWTAERTYFAATLPILITANEYLKKVWQDEGYENYTHKTVKVMDIAR